MIFQSAGLKSDLDVSRAGGFLFLFFSRGSVGEFLLFP